MGHRSRIWRTCLDLENATGMDEKMRGELLDKLFRLREKR